MTAPFLSKQKGEWYRARAADCEVMANEAPDPEAKALLEDMGRLR